MKKPPQKTAAKTSKVATLKQTTPTSDLNIPWLPAIPDRWEMVRSKRLFTVRKQRADADDEQLSATQAYGVIPQAEFERRVQRKVVRITQHLEKRAHVEPDDFVISMRSFQGGLERAWARGCIRSSYVVLKPSPEVHVGYFAHLLKSHDYIRALQATSNFIRDGQDLKFTNFCMIDLPVVPLEEQALMAKFLDHANRKIDGFIRAKRKLMGLLNEQKQALIHRAVTRGLDPTVPLKPSGIPWLGDVPQHWDVTRVKFASRKISKGDTPSNLGRLFTENGPVRFIKIQNIGVGEIIETPRYSIDLETHAMLRRSQLQENDIVYAISGATTGKAAIVRRHHLPANTNQAVAYIRPNGKIVPAFLVAWLHGAGLTKAMWLLTVQSAQPNLSMEELGNLPLLLPLLTEQEDILNWLKETLAPLQSATSQAEREISLLREYRTRLVADVVTGQLDVREAARHLPAETTDALDTTTMPDDPDLDLDSTASEDDA